MTGSAFPPPPSTASSSSSYIAPDSLFSPMTGLPTGLPQGMAPLGRPAVPQPSSYPYPPPPSSSSNGESSSTPKTSGRLGVKRRQKYTRTRTGCLTCRARRIKCDGARPSCRKCNVAKREVSSLLCLGADMDSADFPIQTMYPERASPRRGRPLICERRPLRRPLRQRPCRRQARR